jgi:hypothetical protein
MRGSFRSVAQADQPSWLIGIAQFFVSVVAVVGILTFVTFNPYLLVVIVFAQILLAAGIVLFAIAAVREQRTIAFERTPPVASDIGAVRSRSRTPIDSARSTPPPLTIGS